MGRQKAQAGLSLNFISILDSLHQLTLHHSENHNPGLK